MVVQQLTASSTVLNDGYSVAGATTIHEAVNDPSINDDTSYVYAIGSDSFTVGLRAGYNPGTRANHRILWRSKSLEEIGTPRATQAFLYEGDTLIATSASFTESSFYATHQYILAPSEAETITNYSGLRMKIVSLSITANDQIRITWLSFQIPAIDESKGENLAFIQSWYRKGRRPYLGQMPW